MGLAASLLVFLLPLRCLFRGLLVLALSAVVWLCAGCGASVAVVACPAVVCMAVGRFCGCRFGAAGSYAVLVVGAASRWLWLLYGCRLVLLSAVGVGACAVLLWCCWWVFLLALPLLAVVRFWCFGVGAVGLGCSS
jgi:hypothetical protein